MTTIDPTAASVLEQAWRGYRDAVERGHQKMRETHRFTDGTQHRAELYHSLLEAEAMAFTFAIAPRTDHPLVHNHSWYSYFHTLGGTSPDFRNGTMFLDGQRTYRVTGRFGDLKLVLAQTFSHLLGHPDSKLLMDADFSTFAMGPDGAFDVIMSATPHEGNWIPLDPASDNNFIFIRRIAADWHADRGNLTVAMIDRPADHNDADEAAMARRVQLATHFFDYLVEKWSIGIHDLYLRHNEGRTNVLAVVPGQSIAADFAGSSATNYIWGVFEIADDEALVIETDIPHADYWSFQTMSVWCKPFDFIHRQTDVNMQRAAIDADGKCRLVVSKTDTGVANWMDTAGRAQGIITGRAYHSRAVPSVPVTRLVKLHDLASSLPADTQWVTTEQRNAALARRRSGYLAMYGDEP